MLFHYKWVTKACILMEIYGGTFLSKEAEICYQ